MKLDEEDVISATINATYSNFGGSIAKISTVYPVEFELTEQLEGDFTRTHPRLRNGNDCTGFLVGNNLVMSNWHCFVDSFRGETARRRICGQTVAEFDYAGSDGLQWVNYRDSMPEAEGLNSNQVRQSSCKAHCDKFVYVNRNIDTVIFEVKPDAGEYCLNKRKPIQFAKFPKSKEKIAVFHHPRKITLSP